MDKGRSTKTSTKSQPRANQEPTTYKKVKKVEEGKEGEETASAADAAKAVDEPSQGPTTHPPAAKTRERTPRDDWWDAIVKEWNLPAETKTQKGRIGKLASDMLAAGKACDVGPTSIRRIRENLAEHWNKIAEEVTPEAVAKHFGFGLVDPEEVRSLRPPATSGPAHEPEPGSDAWTEAHFNQETADWIVNAVAEDEAREAAKKDGGHGQP